MPPLKVLIVGGGITGPALGYWLSKLGCDITILERVPDLRASGQQIDLRGEGITVMRRMGIEAAVRAKVVDEEGLQFINEDGQVKAYFEANKTGKGKQSITSEFEIMRGDLVRILYDRTKDKCRYLFGTTVEDFEQRGDGVHVRFSDGQEDDFDLLVGADGQGSRTRRKLLGPNAKDPFRSLDLYLSYFNVPKTEKDSNIARCLNLSRRRALFTRVDNPRTMQVCVATLNPYWKEMEDALRAGDVKAQKQLYAELYKDAGWEVPRLMDGMLNSPEAGDFYGQKVGQVKIDKWSRGRVVLLGDAAYCPSPLTGKGTSLGLIGAYVLAGEISNHLKGDCHGPDGDRGQALDAVLQSYDRLFRPCVEKGQQLIWGIPGLAYPETEWGVWILQLILTIVWRLRINKLFEWFGSDDFGGDWKLPDYPELDYGSVNSVS